MRSAMAIPKLPRRVSGYNLDALLPENGFHVARALVGSEGTLVTILEAALDLVPNPTRGRSWFSATRTSIRRRTTSWTSCRSSRPGSKGMDHLLFECDRRSKAARNADLRCCPTGKGFLLVEFGGDNKDDSDAQAQRLHGDAARSKANPPAMKLFDDEQEEEMVWKVRESGLGATAWVPGEPDAWPGWEDSAVPPERVGGVPARSSAGCSTSTVTIPRSTAISARGASTAASASTCTRPKESRSSAPSWTRRPTWWSATAARCPASTATARPAAELLPKMFGAGADAGLPRVQARSGTRTGR